ncbi:MAG: D-aminoacylase [Bryobacteraceae bacterium]
MRRLIPAALAALCLLGQDPEYDLVISGGRIIDGTGNSWYIGDIGVRGDTIAAIGVLGGAPAKARLDAKGLIVAPGFIDTHSHSRRGIFEAPAAENQIRQGVTTVMEGPDGASPVPLPPFFEKLAATKFSVNFGSLVGQGSIRQKVIGLKDRKAQPAELEAMKKLAREAMADGAFGLSTGLFYLPGTFTPTEEVIALAKEVGALGGVYTSHMRDEADHILDSVRETIRIGEEGGLPSQLTHHKIIGRSNWGRSVDTLRLVAEARERGIDVTIDQYPYTASNTGTAAMFPPWALESGHQALIERLDAPAQRARIRTFIARMIEVDRGGGDPKNVVMANCSFDRSFAGKSLAELTAARGVPVSFETAADTTIEIQRKGGCSAIYHAMSEEDLERILRYPFTMVASDGGIVVMGDGVPHPRNYGAFARVLGRYVRERKVLTLEDAVRRMTGLPAMRFRIFDRGLLRPGMKADVVVFDAATVHDKAEFASPHQYAEGFRHVVVNGKPVLAEGKMTAERPGRILYGPAKK